MVLMRFVIIFFWGSILPPLLTLLVWVYGLHLAPEHLVQSVSFRLFVGLSLCSVLLISIRAFLDRSFSQALIYSGFLFLLLHGVNWYGFRFSGMAAVGEDEQIIDYYRNEHGAYITSPRLPLRVTHVAENPPGLTLVKDGIETHLEPAKTRVRDGYAFRLESVERAPLVSVRSARGEMVDEAYIKLTSIGEVGDYLMFGRLPHRFYVREIKEKNGTASGFRINIVRDKITIVDRLVSSGESVYFDGHFVTCQPGAPWARLSVEKKLTDIPIFTGLVLLCSGIFLKLLAWRKRSLLSNLESI